MRWFRQNSFWIIYTPFLALMAGFAFTNFRDVYVILWPLSMQLVLPMTILISGCLLCGFLLGSALTWWKGRDIRRLAVIRKRQVELLEEEVTDLFDQLRVKSVK